MKHHCGFVCVSLFLLAGCRRPAEQTPADQAGARLVELLAREGNSGPQITYRFSRPLPAGAKVRAGLDASPRAVTEAAWLFFVDDDPYAQWGHPGRIFLYSVSRGSVDIHNVDSYPEVQGADGEWEIVSSQQTRERQATPRDIDPVTAAQLLHPLGDHTRFADRAACREESSGRPCRKYALLLKGSPPPPPFDGGPGPAEKDLAANLARLQRAFAARGFDAIPIPADLNGYIDGIAAKVRCCDEVVFYYIGQAVRGSAPPPGAAESNSPDHVTKRAHYLIAGKPLSGTDLRQILGKLKTCHLQVVIDASYSGGFLAALSQLPGLESFHASSRFDEPSYGRDLDRVRVSVGDSVNATPVQPGSDFTSGFAAGLDAASKDSPAADLVAKGFSYAVENIVTAVAADRDSGLGPRKYETHPTGVSRIVQCECAAAGPPQFGALFCPPK